MKKSRLFPKKRLTGLLALALAGLLPLSGVLAADYADGVYQDLAPGYNDDVIVSVTVKDGKARTHDGAIAGSTLSLLDGVRNYAAFAGVSFGTAVYAATMAPAIEVGLEHEIGSLEPGKDADIAIFDGNLFDSMSLCRLVMIDGEIYKNTL